MFKIKIIVIIALVAAASWFTYHHHQASVKHVAQAAVATTKADAAKAAAVELASHCLTNTLSQEVVVSISKQHMWACEGSKTVYDNAVITGRQMYANELTPTGTYTIYAKEANTVLSGSDQFGSWNDPVSYWMPFLSNNYGVYGFHDATWRPDSDFGNVDINAPGTAAKSGSHGCVEMPLAAAKWLYDWSSVGTTVVIQS